MDDIDKTKEQLLQELSELRKQIEISRSSAKDHQPDSLSPEETEALYKTAIEHSNDGVIILSGNERLYCNKKYLEILGYDSYEEVSENLFSNWSIPMTGRWWRSMQSAGRRVKEYLRTMNAGW